MILRAAREVTHRQATSMGSSAEMDRVGWRAMFPCCPVLMYAHTTQCTPQHSAAEGGSESFWFSEDLKIVFTRNMLCPRLLVGNVAAAQDRRAPGSRLRELHWDSAAPGASLLT